MGPIDEVDDTEKRKMLPSAGIRTPDLSAHSLVTILDYLGTLLMSVDN
jgi:hypothetical protein